MPTKLVSPVTDNGAAKPLTVLRVDASPRGHTSISRALSDDIVATLAEGGPVTVTLRDLVKDPVPALDDAWVGATFTDPAERTPEQRAALATSDALVAEVKAADLLVIGLPVHNFGPPAALKAWFDMIARARETFRYTASGAEGLLGGRRAIIAMASGGVEAGSASDFASPWLRHALGFLGITEVTLVAADRHMTAGPERVAATRAGIRDVISGLGASGGRAA